MKQTTKVLLPLGLFMSVVIPIAVKTIFTETNFFESDNTAKFDYLQPYKAKPESLIGTPKIHLGDNGLIIEIASPTGISTNNVQAQSYYKNSGESKKTIAPESAISTSELELQSQANIINSEDIAYK